MTSIRLPLTSMSQLLTKSSRNPVSTSRSLSDNHWHAYSSPNAPRTCDVRFLAVGRCRLRCRDVSLSRSSAILTASIRDSSETRYSTGMHNSICRPEVTGTIAPTTNQRFRPKRHMPRTSSSQTPELVLAEQQFLSIHEFVERFSRLAPTRQSPKEAVG